MLEHKIESNMILPICTHKMVKSETQRRREVGAKSITNTHRVIPSENLKKSDGITNILDTLDPHKRADIARGRQRVILEILKTRLEGKPVEIETLLSLIRTSGNYRFHKVSDAQKEDMMKWDIWAICYDGKGGTIKPPASSG